MAKVTGLGGVFMKCRDPKALKAWYQKHLGCPETAADDPGISFPLKGEKGFAVWGPFKADTKYFDPSAREFMINFRVDDLDGLLAKLKAAGIDQVGVREDHEYGCFAWILDPEGTKIELWQPVAEKSC